MKKQNKIKTVIQLSAIVVLLCCMMLSAGMSAQKQKIPAATYMGGNDTIKEVCREMEAAGVSNVDVFQEWAADFAASAGNNANLEDTWSDPEKMSVDIGKCMDGWEQNHDYSDSNCRMTAFLLLDGLLHAETTENSYNGSYLMFDTEAIEICLLHSMVKRVLRMKNIRKPHFPTTGSIMDFK